MSSVDQIEFVIEMPPREYSATFVMTALVLPVALNRLKTTSILLVFIC